jgi:hypothetical protein
LNDKKLIYSYLNNTFEIQYDKGLRYLFLDTINNRIINFSEFRNIFLKTFGDWDTDDYKSSTDIFLKWIEEKHKFFFKELDDYLNDCQIILRDGKWFVFKNDNTIVTTKEIIKLSNNKFETEFLSYYNEWFKKSVSKKYEEIFNTW